MNYGNTINRMISPNISNEIRLEIQRFESVHPSIYAIYDLIEEVTDPNLRNQIRDHVVNIEDSFVNSQEWTTSRGVQDLKLGIAGFVNSGKSALVHRYLTGSYMHEESPEGGRFKKEIQVDGHSYLLLIRDEGGMPEAQFANWVDVVIFVFSLENEMSLNAVHGYYNKMCHYRDMSQLPVILVGTQDAISETNPRVIEDSRAKQLEHELGARCKYYETCATYGLNVEHVFQDACQRAIHERIKSYGAISRSTASTLHRSHTTGSHTAGYATPRKIYPQPNMHPADGSDAPGPLLREHSSSSIHRTERQQRSSSSSNYSSNPQLWQQSANPPSHLAINPSKHAPLVSQYSPKHEQQLKVNMTDLRNELEGVLDKRHTTPNSTPVLSRKNNKKAAQSPRNEEMKIDELGMGREIPLKQGFLYKKGSKGITKDWKKKYVTLTTTGKLIYHPNIHDYMGDVHGKEISLIQTTVKIPGQNKPRLKTQLSQNGAGQTNASTVNFSAKTSHSMPRDIMGLSSSHLTPGFNGFADMSAVAGIQAAKMESSTPHIKRRHRRAKSGSKIEANGDGNDSDGYEFTIVSLDNKQWQFEAPTSEERDVWVQNIENQILQSLQGNITQRKTVQDPNAVLAIRSMPGNNVCADCGQEDPSWASLNLGSLICIECSGIHRNLGTHHSRVRSLELDEWPPDLIAVMLAIGNHKSNSIWEAKASKSQKPIAQSSRELKEQWIRAKYEQKEHLAERTHRNAPLSHLLIDAIARQDLSQVMVCLADSTPDEVSAAYSPTDRRTPLHIAAQQDNAVFLQLLLWYGADVKKLDLPGRSALWYAKQVGSKDCAAILLANGTPEAQATLQTLRKPSLKTPAIINNNEKQRDRVSINSVN